MSTSKDEFFFSVIIPVYNSISTIQRCFNSLASQSFDDFEIIFVDDGSTDGSGDFIEQNIVPRMEHRTRLFQKKNEGAGEARNFGIDQAIGKYLVFVDSDDYVDSNFLNELFQLFSNRDLDLVFIDIVREDAEGRFIRYEKLSDFRHLNKREFLNLQDHHNHHNQIKSKAMSG